MSRSGTSPLPKECNVASSKRICKSQQSSPVVNCTPKASGLNLQQKQNEFKLYAPVRLLRRIFASQTTNISFKFDALTHIVKNICTVKYL